MLNEKILEELKKLPPKERIKRIEKIKEDLRKESDEMISDAAEEMDLQEELEEQMNEAAEEAKKEIIEVNMPLEATVEKEAEGLTVPDAGYDRIVELSREPAQDLYNRLTDLANEADRRGYVTREAAETAYEIQQAFYQKETALKTGEYNPTEYLREISSAEHLAKELMRDYQTQRRKDVI